MSGEASSLELFTRAYWDERYGHEHHVWSGRPNAQLVAHVNALPPRRALEVACGEGADAIWLAERGWEVTAVDVSPIGLGKAETHARNRGEELAARIQWRAIDLFADECVELGGFELVTSHFLHLPPAVLDRAVGRLAAAVAPGGDLLYVAHDPSDLEIPGLRPHVPEMFHSAEELAAQLDGDEWEVLEAGAQPRAGEISGGERVTVHDAVLHARRI